MRRLWPLSLALLACFLPVPILADGAFVVAVHQGGVYCVLNYNHPNASSAQAAALSICRRGPAPHQCRVMANFRDYCYAYAFAPSGGYGAGGGVTLAEAHANALVTCQRYNPFGGCQVRDSGCDTVGAAEAAARQAEEQRRQQEAEAERIAEQAREATRLEAQRADLERQRQALTRRAQEQRAREQQLEREQAEMRAFADQHAACRAYQLAACDQALRSVRGHGQVAAELTNWRQIAVTLQNDRDQCRAGVVTACTAALASPAASEDLRPQLELWRAAASPYYKTLMWLSGSPTVLITAVQGAQASILALPTSTHIMGMVAALLAIALAVMAVRQRSTSTPAAPETAASTVKNEPPETSDQPNRPSLLSRCRQQLAQWAGRLQAGPPSAKPSSAVLPAVLVTPPPIVRDTPGALAAMELAWAYLDEVRQAPTPGLDDKPMRKDHLNTLSLASRQLELAGKLDPDAVLENSDGDAVYRYSLNELKAEALLLEGVTHQTHDVKRALPALRQATELHPNSARAFYVLGLAQAANMNKADAVAALEQAVALDPKNLAYRKELNRAQSLTVAEIAGYKATRVGEKVFDAGIKTANAGIFVYNIGVYTWNVFAFVWNVLTFPLRMVLKLFGLFDRLLGIK